MVSEKHCNFLINTGAATAADIETLGETVRRRVRETTRRRRCAGRSGASASSMPVAQEAAADEASGSPS